MVPTTSKMHFPPAFWPLDTNKQINDIFYIVKFLKLNIRAYKDETNIKLSLLISQRNV